jgi:hypothetical protein
MEKFSIDTYTSKLAIGSIWIIGCFLFACSFNGSFFLFIENLSAKNTWNILMTIPVLIFTYLIGGIIINLCNVFVVIFNKDYNHIEIQNFIEVAKIENEFILNKYESTKNQYDLFLAGIPTFIFLGMSVIFGSIFNLSSEPISFTLGIITILLSYLLFLVCKNLQDNLIQISKNIKNPHNKSDI